jgi:hypothetical protein
VLVEEMLVQSMARRVEEFEFSTRAAYAASPSGPNTAILLEVRHHNDNACGAVSALACVVTCCSSSSATSTSAIQPTVTASGSIGCVVRCGIAATAPAPRSCC